LYTMGNVTYREDDAESMGSILLYLLKLKFIF